MPLILGTRRWRLGEQLPHSRGHLAPVQLDAPQHEPESLVEFLRGTLVLSVVAQGEELVICLR